MDELRSRACTPVLAQYTSRASALTTAKRAFSALGGAAQLAVIRQIIDTRGDELRRAYPSILELGAGFRHRSDKRGATRILRRSPLCLRLTVYRKWNKARDVDSRSRIPGHVLTTIGPPESSTLVAVATDIEQQPPRSARRHQATISVDENPEGGAQNRGSVACIVREMAPDGATRYGAISCMHVLSGRDTGERRSGITVVRLDDALSTLGISMSRCRSLDDPGQPNFDAQWLEITNTAAASELLGLGLSFAGRGIAIYEDLFIPPLSIVTSRGDIPVWFTGYWPATQIVEGTRVAHRSLLAMNFSTRTRTIKGDSGSPLVSGPPSNRVLVGMHIALEKHKDRLASLCIPAWELFNPALYRPRPRDVHWALF